MKVGVFKQILWLSELLLVSCVHPQLLVGSVKDLGGTRQRGFNCYMIGIYASSEVQSLPASSE